jgi:signal peptidase
MTGASRVSARSAPRGTIAMSTHRSQGTRRRRTAGSITTTVLAWLVIAAVTVALLVAVALPRVMGATPYTVLTGSMRPTMPPGTLVVVDPVDIDDLRVGDVITYQLRSGEPAVVTHRVTSVSSTLAGERTVQTQGDANPVADALPVTAQQVRGKVSYAIPYLGRVNTLMSGSQRETATTAVAIALGLYALFMATSGLLERRRSRTIRRHVPTERRSPA